MTSDKKDFIVTKNKDESVTFSIRIERKLQAELDNLAAKSNRSRNELIEMSIRYALSNLKFLDD